MASSVAQQAMAAVVFVSDFTSDEVTAPDSMGASVIREERIAVKLGLTKKSGPGGWGMSPRRDLRRRPPR